MQDCWNFQLDCQRVVDLAKPALDNRGAGSIKSLPCVCGHCLLWIVIAGPNKALLGHCVTVAIAGLLGRACESCNGLPAAQRCHHWQHQSCSNNRQLSSIDRQLSSSNKQLSSINKQLSSINKQFSSNKQLSSYHSSSATGRHLVMRYLRGHCCLTTTFVSQEGKALESWKYGIIPINLVQTLPQQSCF